MRAPSVGVTGSQRASASLLDAQHRDGPAWGSVAKLPLRSSGVGAFVASATLGRSWLAPV